MALPSLLLLLLLGLCVLTDLRSNRIPNSYVIVIFFFGISIHFVTNGFHAVAVGVVGTLAGLTLSLPLYLLKGMAAGDVKLMAAVGSFLGPVMTIQAVLATLIAGGVLGIGYMLLSGPAMTLLSRYAFMARTTALTGKLIYIPGGESDPGKKRFPYATAIFTGTIVTLWLNDMLPTGLSL